MNSVTRYGCHGEDHWCARNPRLAKANENKSVCDPSLLSWVYIRDRIRALHERGLLDDFERSS